MFCLLTKASGETPSVVKGPLTSAGPPSMKLCYKHICGGRREVFLTLAFEGVFEVGGRQQEL